MLTVIDTTIINPEKYALNRVDERELAEEIRTYIQMYSSWGNVTNIDIACAGKYILIIARGESL